MEDRIAQLYGQPTLSSLLNSVQLPADLTDDTRVAYKAIQTRAGNLNEYPLKYLKLLEKIELIRVNAINCAKRLTPSKGFTGRQQTL